MPGDVDVRATECVRRARRHAEHQADIERSRAAGHRHAIDPIDARAMPLVGHRGCPPGAFHSGLAISGIREELRRQRPAGRVLAVEVAPRPRQRVVATDFDAAAEAVVRLERPALIAALEIVRVLDQVDVERLPSALVTLPVDRSVRVM